MLRLWAAECVFFMMTGAAAAPPAVNPAHRFDTSQAAPELFETHLADQSVKPFGEHRLTGFAKPCLGVFGVGTQSARIDFGGR